MDFDLTDEQGMLRDVTREALTQTYDIETLLKVGDTELGWSREVWSQLADIGILGLGFDPEEAGQLELMVVLTELGRRLAPEPVAQAALIPGGLIAELGRPTTLVARRGGGGTDAAGAGPSRARHARADGARYHTC